MSAKSTFLSSLRRHDPLDVAAGCGGLLLLPENANPERLLALSAYCLRATPSRTQRVSSSRWRSWLIDAPSLHEGAPWDPPEGLFSNALQFIGGSYIVVSRGDPIAPFDLQLLLDVLAFAPWDEDGHAFRERAIPFALAGLRLAHAASAAAGVSRYEPARPSDRVLVPNDSQLAALIDAVTFDGDQVVRFTDGAPEILDPLVHDLASGPLAAGDWPFDLKPLVRRDDRLVLCDPTALLVALRHQLILLAIETGQRSALAEFLGEWAAQRTQRCCELMGWQPIERRDRPDGVPLKQLIFGFDHDKACDVIVIYDDLAGYDVANAQAMWDSRALVDPMLERMRAIEQALMMGPGARPNEILHLTVMSGIGRMSVMGMPEVGGPVGAAQKLLSLEALDTLTMAGADRLALYKCARAGERLRSHARVLAYSPLDEYAAWCDHDESFYLGDGPRPNLVIFEGDYGRTLREKAARLADLHAAVTPDGTFVPVVRLMEDVPIYGVLDDLSGSPRLLVEGLTHRWWIVTDPAAQPQHRGVYAQLIDAIAYWLWQFDPALNETSGEPDTTVIEVQVADPTIWSGSQVPSVDGPVVEVDVRPDGRVVVLVQDAMLTKLYRATNEAERELMRAILLVLGEGSRQRGGLGLSEHAIDAAIARHAPVGPKKKINIFTSTRSLSLVGAGLPPSRTVQAADSSDILDELGPALQQRLALPVGPIPDDERVRVLGATVAIHFEELAQLVSTLSSDGLLERLVALHEALLHESEKDRHTVGARIACYGETGLVDELRKKLPKANAAAISARFLVEYVAAVPPTGLRPLSLSLYDRLLALASEITNRGMASDAINYGLVDSELSILESGRLGQSRDDEVFYTGQQQFLDVAVPSQIRSAAASYGRAWHTEPSQRPDFADRLDAACVDEFGLTMTEIIGLHTALAQKALQLADGGVAVMSRAALEEDLVAELDWPQTKAATAIDLLALGPREDFLQPESGFDRTDVYPWRFNRALSYLRRPLLLRGGGEEVVWGMRHTETSGRHLLDLILSERYRATAPTLKQLMTELRQDESRAFNDHVADLCRQAGMIVKTNVSKVGREPIERVPGQPLGDLDVVAADTARLTLHLLECKDLAGARTPAELSNELKTTFGSGGKKSSAAQRHVERVDWVRRHLAQTLSFLGVGSGPEGWSVQGRMVVDTPVMSPFVAQCPLPAIDAAGLGAELAALAEPPT